MDQKIRDEIQNLAEVALHWFERRRRHDGNKYWAVKEGAPYWVKDLVRAAHDKGRLLPEDFRYRFIVEALEAIVENPEEPEILWEPDIYLRRLLAWLESGSSYRIILVDKVVSELGWHGLYEALQAGQLREKEEVLGLVLEFMERKIEKEGEEH